jgi:hypothetical protein
MSGEEMEIVRRGAENEVQFSRLFPVNRSLISLVEEG